MPFSFEESFGGGRHAHGHEHRYWQQQSQCLATAAKIWIQTRIDAESRRLSLGLTVLILQEQKSLTWRPLFGAQPLFIIDAPRLGIFGFRLTQATSNLAFPRTLIVLPFFKSLPHLSNEARRTQHVRWRRHDGGRRCPSPAAQGGHPSLAPGWSARVNRCDLQ